MTAASPAPLDVAIVGGGPAGAAAAVGLARSGVRVALLERDAAPRSKPGEILEPTVRQALGEIGIASGFEALKPLRGTGNVSVWGADRPIEIDSIVNPHGSSYFVDRRRMEQWLIGEARQSGVRVVQGVRGVTVEPGSAPRISWQQENGRVETRVGLVVDASGRNGCVGGWTGRRRFDRLVGLLAYLSHGPDQLSDRRIYIEATRDGWWYSAPLPDEHCVVAFMTDADLVPAGKGPQLELFRHRLAQTKVTRQRVATCAPVCSVCTSPAMSTLRNAIGGPGWVAIGDAAATYDPLSGGGVATALSKGTALARLIAQGRGIDRSICEYAEAEHAAYDDYLAIRRTIYGRERRWPSAHFWRRRHAAPLLAFSLHAG